MTTTHEKQKVVQKVFTDFLKGHGLRKTAEQMAILKETYNMESHFDVDELHIQMRLKKFWISRATIYNNIDLLLGAKLIWKHQFGRGMAEYERSYFFGQHDHIILTDTGEVKEFCDPRIGTVKKSLGKIFQVAISRHSLYFYGVHKANRLPTSETEEVNQMHAQ